MTERERESFLHAAAGREKCVRSFCWMLAATGCRISEALALSEDSIDFEAGHVIVESLKKRGKQVFRTIPLSPPLLRLLRDALDEGILGPDRLWPWSRMTGYRRVCEVMQAARVTGAHASPKGLRHAFGVSAIQSNIPLNLIQRWLGHADIKTTTIYTDAMGPEERQFASRMWRSETKRGPQRQPRRKRIVVVPRVPSADVGTAVVLPVTGHDQTPTDTFLPQAARKTGSLLRLARVLNNHVGELFHHACRSEEPERRFSLA